MKRLLRSMYWDRFEEPDNWIWAYCRQAKDPWVEWPSADGFQRYQQAVIDVYKLEDYPF